MDIRKIPIDQIQAAKYNPRKDLQPGDPEYEKLKRSILEFGFVEPPVWNRRTRNLVGGHQRFKILTRELGMTEVECSVVDMDDSQERALNVALNKISGDWDQDLLAKLMDDLVKADYDPTLTGYDQKEIDQLLASLNVPDGPDEEGFDAGAAYDAIQEPITKPGDVIQLGRHRLMCGDSTILPDVQTLMGGRLADLVLTDPPYNVNYEGGTGMTIQNDNMDDSAFFNFLLAFYQCAFEVSRPGAPVYIWHADSEGLNFRRALREAGWLMKQTLVWVKNSLVLGRQDYQWKHEPCLYGWKPGAAHTWYGGRAETTVFIDEETNLKKLGKPELIAMIKALQEQIKESVLLEDKPSKNDLHPTMKPVNLIARLIKNSSKRGDVVADFFGGSGTTMIAAEQTGRTAYLMEFDPKYADVIVARWEKYTGQQAVRP